MLSSIIMLVFPFQPTQLAVQWFYCSLLNTLCRRLNEETDKARDIFIMVARSDFQTKKAQLPLVTLC